jgi:2-amino-4-hydroxy-6-hydroxymethyldihydropteridine diphosphokinase
MSLQLPELELPHPRMIERPFVMTPLAEICPELRLPSWKMTCLEYALGMRKK